METCIAGETQWSWSWAVPTRVDNVAHYITKCLFNLDQTARTSSSHSDKRQRYAILRIRAWKRHRCSVFSFIVSMFQSFFFLLLLLLCYYFYLLFIKPLLHYLLFIKPFLILFYYSELIALTRNRKYFSFDPFTTARDLDVTYPFICASRFIIVSLLRHPAINL